MTLLPNTTGFGAEQASAIISGGRICLRVNADIRPGTGRQGRLSYSSDGTNVTPLGPGFVIGNNWRLFMGYRYATWDTAGTSPLIANRATAGTAERFDLVG